MVSIRDRVMAKQLIWTVNYTTLRNTSSREKATIGDKKHLKMTRSLKISI